MGNSKKSSRVRDFREDLLGGTLYLVPDEQLKKERKQLQKLFLIQQFNKMQRACWQDEDEAFDDGPALQYVRTKAPWEAHSMTSASLREDEEMRRLARNVCVKPLWAPPSEADLNAQFERELAAQEYKFATPWDQVRPGDNVQKMEAEAKAFDDRNRNYKYQAMWAEPEMTASRLEQLACYTLNAPFEREGDEPERDAAWEKRKEKLAAMPRTIAPWKYGQEPSIPIREKKSKDTSLWDNLEPSAKKQSGMPSSGDPVLDTVRDKLLERGNSILGMAKRFKIMDDDRSGSLDFTEFRKGLKECQVGITEMQIKHIFKLFDKDDNGTISYEEFLVGLRGTLNSRRKAIVRVAFSVLDGKGRGYINLDDIKSKYNARGHPDVIQHIRTEEEVLRELLDHFETGIGTYTAAITAVNNVKVSAAVRSGSATKGQTPVAGIANVKGDGLVTLDEFTSYYANISASIDNDDYFELMMRNAWHLSGGEGWAGNTTIPRVLVTHADGKQVIEETKANPMSIDYSRSVGAAGDKATNSKGHHLNHLPVAGVSSDARDSRNASARRPSNSSDSSTRGGPYGLAAGPGANMLPQPHVPAKTLPGPFTGHIRGIPNKSAWTTNPAAAAADSMRVLQDIMNSSPAPSSLAAALVAKQVEAEKLTPQQPIGGLRPPPKVTPASKNVAPTYSPEQLASAAAAQRRPGQPMSLREQLAARSGS